MTAAIDFISIKSMSGLLFGYYLMETNPLLSDILRSTLDISGPYLAWVYNDLVPTLKEDRLYVNTIPKKKILITMTPSIHSVVPYSYGSINIDDTSTVSVMYLYMYTYIGVCINNIYLQFNNVY